jgi:uncharacterized RDD family membrane protein YckC
VVDRRQLGSWLSGPGSLSEATGADVGYPGKRLGLPEDGPNSVAGLSRRFAATMIDWIIASLIARAIVPHPSQAQQLWLAPAVFAVMNLALLTTVGAGIGGRVLGMRVARLDGANPNLVTVAIRTLWLLPLIPALWVDRDYRGLHDRLAQTIVIRR